MRIAGILQPGTTLGYVVEGKYVQGGLIVVQTLQERDALVNSGTQALVNGTPIYVSSTKTTYRYNADTKLFTSEPTFVEDENGVLNIVGEDGQLKKVKLEITIDDLDPTLKETIENLPTLASVEELINSKLGNYVTLSSFQSTIDELSSRLDKKQDSLIAGNNIKIEGNVISAIYENVEQLRFANKADFPLIGKEDVLYIAKDEKAIYLWDASIDSYSIISSSSSIDIDIINGGNAEHNI